MVVFHTDHWGALAQYIILAIIKHKNDECVFCMPRPYESKEKEKILIRLSELGVFKRIVFFPDSFPGAKLTDPEEIRQAVVSEFDKVFADNNVFLDDSVTFYSETDFQGTFRLYLSFKKYKYTHVMLYDWDIYDPYKETGAYSIGFVTKEYMALLNSNNVFNGKSIYCSKIISFPETVIKEEMVDKEFEVLNLAREIKTIDAEWGAKLLKCFGTNALDTKNAKGLLLSNSDGHLLPMINLAGYNGFDEKEQTLIYQVLLDFYSSLSPDKIIIKPHPDCFVKWDKYFPDVKIIGKYLPIEFLHFKCFNSFFKEALAIDTTSIGKVREKFFKTIWAGIDFARYYRCIYSLFFCCKLFNQLGYNTNVREIFGFENGENNDFLVSFARNALDDLRWSGHSKCGTERDRFQIYYKPDIEEFARIMEGFKSITLNSAAAIVQVPDNIPLVCWNGILSYLTVYKIKKEPKTAAVVLPLDSEYVWFLSKSPDIRSKLRAADLKKECKTMGVELEFVPLNEQEQDAYLRDYLIMNELQFINARIDYENIRFQNKNGRDNLICNITDPEQYFDALSVTENIIVFIAVKDNAGKAYSFNLIKFIERIGLKTRWNRIGWNSYFAIIDNKTIIEEKLGVAEYNGCVDSLNVAVDTKSFSNGNHAGIVINGADYAVNERGINIVVYDKTNECVIDSVCFDFFTAKCRCSRKNI